MTFALPPEVLEFAGRGPAWAQWVRRLPRLVESILDEWELGVDGAPMSGFTALVVPVTRRDGERAVLKLVCPGDEEENEHLALQRWGGRGAVRLLQADPARVRSCASSRPHRRSEG